MKRKQLQQGRGAIELIEETFHLLRGAPPAVLLAYYCGSLPFVLGLLYFWADMSRSTFAGQRLASAAFGLSLLFVWMKAWQSVFAHRLLARLCGEPAPRWRPGRFLRAALVQGILQPSGFIVLPAAIVVLIPFGWAYAFYQNVTVLGAGETSDVRQLAKTAWHQAKLWPRQNNYGLVFLQLFGIFVFINVVTAFVAGPYLLKTLLGVESVFTRSWGAVANPTFLFAMLGLTYLCMDPVAKCFYVLRCFYGDSLQTGQDLKVELKHYLPAAKLAVAGVLVWLVSGVFMGTLVAPNEGGARMMARARCPHRAELVVEQFAAAWGHAALPIEQAVARPGNTGEAETSPRTSGEEQTAEEHAKAWTPNSVSAGDLDRVISEVINRREYNWRLPREKVPEGAVEQSAFAAFVESMGETLQGWARSAFRWLQKVIDWLSGGRRSPTPSIGSGGLWLAGLHWVLVCLIVALACVLAVMIFRMWQRRRRRSEPVVAAVAQPAPDVADETVGADQLPEDGWMKLARELVEKGEVRLALRAFYLASLAHLAERGLIVLARFKSNGEYAREVGRRGHALPELAGTFAENVSVFDRVWYGLHEVNQELLDRFARNVEKMKGNEGRTEVRAPEAS